LREREEHGPRQTGQLFPKSKMMGGKGIGKCFPFYQSLQAGWSKYWTQLSWVSRGGGEKREYLKISSFNPDPFWSIEHLRKLDYQLSMVSVPQRQFR